jgi:hypothetical protein
LCHIVERLLIQAYTGASVECRPGLILFVQTFGDLVTFNPHVHVLAAAGLIRLSLGHHDYGVQGRGKLCPLRQDWNRRFSHEASAERQAD